MKSWMNRLGAILLLPLTLAAADRAALEKRAAAGDAGAQYQLAEALFWGQDGEQDLKQAVDWARLAAKAGHAKGQYRLAFQLLLGQGVEPNAENDELGFKNLEAAQAGLEKAAAQGDPDAQHKLALLYLYGLAKGHAGLPYAINRKQAITLFEKSANAGHVGSQHQMALVHILGLTSKSTHAKALEWLRKAAKNGSVYAANELWKANRHSKGQLVKLEEAKPHLITAAQAGLAPAQFHYGRALGEGELGPADKKAAITWLKKAAEQGHGLAQYYLALSFLNSQLQEPDHPRAFYWMTLARNNPSLEAQAGAQRYRPGLQRIITAEQQFEIQQEVKQFKPQPTLVTRNFNLGLSGVSLQTVVQIRVQHFTLEARRGNVEAMMFLGDTFLREPTLNEALRWYEMAAKKNNVRACTQLALMHLDGVTGKLLPDFHQGIKWLRQAAELGDPLSMNRLGTHIILGDLKGVKPGEGLKWITQSARQGYALAQSNLGRFWYDGDQVEEQDYSKAKEWFQKAAEQNYPVAQFRLGKFYLTGPGKFKPNIIEAIKWFRLAARQGFPDAQFALGGIYMDGTDGTEKDPQTGYYWLEISRRSGMRGVDATLKRYENDLTQEQKQRAIAQAAKFRASNFYNENTGGSGTPAATAKLGQLSLKDLTAQANTGDADAQYHLAERYAGGRGIALDPVQAWKWYQLADEGDHPTAAAARSKLVKVQGMTLDQILAARELVSQFKPRKK